MDRSRWALIVAATSDIGRAVAHELARRGFHLHLTARHPDHLADDVQDLRIRYNVEIRTHALDVCDYTTHPVFAEQLNPIPQVIVLMAGYLGNNEQAEHDLDERRRIMEVNYNGAASVIAALVPHLSSGAIIAGVSSVAGDRPRGTLYWYGSAKCGLSGFLDGLRMRLYERGIHVITIKPGVVATKMTAHLPIAQTPLTATPERVARDIAHAIEKRKSTLYTPWYWRWIMLVLRWMPETIIRRMKN